MVRKYYRHIRKTKNKLDMKRIQTLVTMVLIFMLTFSSFAQIASLESINAIQEYTAKRKLTSKPIA